MSGGGVPANTSSTTTVNQSPWQNKTYRTLALGTPENLGPVAQQLKIGQQLTKDWMDIQSGRNPGLYYGLKNATPERLAQETALRDVGFAGGRAPIPGAAPAATPTPTDTPTATAAEGGLMSLRGFATGRTAAPKPKPKPAPKPKPEVLAQPEADKNESGLTAAQQKQWDNLEKLRNSGKKMTQQQIKAYNDLKGIRTTATEAAAADPAKQNQPTGAPYSYSDLATPTAFLDPKTGQNMLPDAQLAYQRARELTTPEQIGQATNAYNTGLAGLKEAAKYQADKVSTDPYTAAQMTAPEQAAVKDYDAAQMQAAQMQGSDVVAAQINRGDVRDINAIMADVERYQAAGMQAPPALQAEAYKAAQMKGAQMQGPKSWTDPGVAQQYMNPYQQAVVDQEKFESNRNFLQNLNSLRGGAAKSKAYGGTRQAMQEAEALRNQGYTLADIQNKGSAQAYQQGMQQFATEQGQGLQAGQANLQANLTTQQQNQAALNNQRSLYVQQALDAAKTSYGGELTAAQQNQIAQNAAAQFNAQSQNTAYNNYSAQQLAAQQANQGMDWNVANQNAQLSQQAALANQLYGTGGFQTNLQNAQFSQQANQQNQAAINQQRSQYVNNALQAAMQAYGGQLTAEQQNQAALNAASQFNRQQSLQGQMANQQAGLQANQQNIGAYSAMGGMAQGLGNLGATQNQIQLNNLGALGQSATAQTNYAQGALDRQTQNAMNWYNLPSTFNAPGINALNSQQVSGGTNQSSQWYNQARPFAKGGKVKWGPKK